MTIEPHVGQRGEKRAAGAHHHAGRAAADEVPLVVALAGRHARVHDGHGIAEAAAEAAHRLRGERDLGHEHARRARPCGEDALDGLQVHLGLAGARDAVDEHHMAVGGIAGGGDSVERLRLARGELRLRRGNMRCVFIARRQVGNAGARPARMALASGLGARSPPFDDAPANGLPEANRLFADRIPGSTRNRALRDARRVSENPRMRRRCSMSTAPFASKALSVEETDPS